jgi:hypothetical protein
MYVSTIQPPPKKDLAVFRLSAGYKALLTVGTLKTEEESATTA